MIWRIWASLTSQRYWSVTDDRRCAWSTGVGLSLSVLLERDVKCSTQPCLAFVFRGFSVSPWRSQCHSCCSFMFGCISSVSKGCLWCGAPQALCPCAVAYNTCVHTLAVHTVDSMIIHVSCGAAGRGCSGRVYPHSQLIQFTDQFSDRFSHFLKRGLGELYSSLPLKLGHRHLCDNQRLKRQGTISRYFIFIHFWNSGIILLKDIVVVWMEMAYGEWRYLKRLGHTALWK